MVTDEKRYGILEKDFASLYTNQKVIRLFFGHIIEKRNVKQKIWYLFLDLCITILFFIFDAHGFTNGQRDIKCEIQKIK